MATEHGETLVVSHVYNGYVRARQPDGHYRAETYVFANGGLVDGEPVAGDEVGVIPFGRVAGYVGEALKVQGYVPDADPATTGLMIMLWYGTTRDTTAKPAAYRMVQDLNTRILGLQKDRSRADALSFASFARDFQDEFRAGRYFVVLKAYDFQVARREKRLKLLWESRFSLRRQGGNFTAGLPVMAGFAARTFGHETGGIFNPDSTPGRVELGEMKILGEMNR